MQRVLADAFAQRGCQTFEATDQREGVRLLRTMRPDLIFLDPGAAPDAEWDTFERMRALTDAPMILAVQHDAARPSVASRPNTAILVKPISAAQVTARARALGVVRSTARAFAVDTLTTHRLSAADLARIDRALSQVGERGEVRLIIQQGRLRFLEKHVTTSLKREPVPA